MTKESPIQELLNKCYKSTCVTKKYKSVYAKHNRYMPKLPTYMDLQKRFIYWEGEIYYRNNVGGGGRKGCRAGSYAYSRKGEVVSINWKSYPKQVVVWLWHGNPLRVYEEVIHKDGNRLNCDIDNLDVRSKI